MQVKPLAFRTALFRPFLAFLFVIMITQSTFAQERDTYNDGLFFTKIICATIFSIEMADSYWKLQQATTFYELGMTEVARRYVSGAATSKRMALYFGGVGIFVLIFLHPNPADGAIISMRDREQLLMSAQREFESWQEKPEQPEFAEKLGKFVWLLRDLIKRGAIKAKYLRKFYADYQTQFDRISKLSSPEKIQSFKTKLREQIVKKANESSKRIEKGIHSLINIDLNKLRKLKDGTFHDPEERDRFVKHIHQVLRNYAKIVIDAYERDGIIKVEVAN